MKNLFKIPLLIATLSVSLTGFNQAPETPSPLNSIINPSQSRGYIYWNSFEGADQYLIRIYEVDEDKVYTTISETFTTKNYFSLGIDYLLDASKSYSISAYNRGEFIEESDRTPFQNGAGPTEICSKKCNGSTYAYQLSYLESEVGIDKLRLTPTYNIVDNVNGIYTPFYQAVSDDVYNAMVAEGHPYTLLNDQGIYDYQHIHIDLSTPGGPFHDKDNNVVNNGWLIEKKMDQFSYMNLGSTTADPGIGICSASMTSGGGWMDFYNAYDDEILYGPLPSLVSVEPFINYVPTSLECSLAGTGGSGGWVPNTDWAVPNWSSTSYFPCIIEIVTFVNWTGGTIDLVPCISNEISPGTGYSGFLFEPLDPDLSNVIVTNDNGHYTVEGELVVGIYNIHIFSNSGDILSTVIEVTEEDLIPEPAPTSTAVDLSIAPNPILENMLIYSISSELETSVRITITNLNGEITFDSEESLSRESDLRMEMSVDPETYRYGQIVITLTFPDGSTIQEIGLIE